MFINKEKNKDRWRKGLDEFQKTIPTFVIETDKYTGGEDCKFHRWSFNEYLKKLELDLIREKENDNETRRH